MPVPVASRANAPSLAAASHAPAAARARRRFGPRRAPCPALAVLALCGGCGLLSSQSDRPAGSPPPTPAAAVERQAPQRDAERADQLRRLLAAAEDALAENRLLTPSHDCAHLYYVQALELAPTNAEALRGFERIVEAYLALARRAAAREAWASARGMLDRAAQIDGAHAGIAALRRQVEILASARRVALTLDRQALRERRREMAQRLAALGEQARQANARVAIRAGSDAAGRWIYEQLNRAPGERRIRGNIEIGIPPRVTILFLSTGEEAG